jgi:hypothetical protein
MTLKRDLWTNQEVIDILESRKISIKMDDAKTWSKKRYDWVVQHNEAIEQCIIQFCDFKADPEESFSAMAYETDNGQIYVVSEPMPQTEEEHQAYLKKEREKSLNKLAEQAQELNMGYES